VTGRESGSEAVVSKLGECKLTLGVVILLGSWILEVEASISLTGPKETLFLSVFSFRVIFLLKAAWMLGPGTIRPEI
jgi:hypothetical protein